MDYQQLRTFLEQNKKALIVCVIGGLTILFLSWVIYLNSQINERLESGWFSPPVEIYSAPRKIFPGTQLYANKLSKDLLAMGFRKRDSQEKLLENDYSLWPLEWCQNHLQEVLPDEVTRCFIYRNQSNVTNMIALSGDSEVVQTYSQEPLKLTEFVELPPLLFAQFYNGKPMMREIVELGEIPLMCAQAVTAIEDEKFLEHSGVSPIGLLRATFNNIVKGRYAQGGSTITQQLVKNYFLTSEKTIKRKITELLMSLILETKYDKDQILQNYLNVIYMGQNGPFEVRGFASASKHYFNKSVTELDLSECSMLAALLNSPGRYNPISKPEAATQRRKLVLDKMLELGMVEEAQATEASTKKLPTAKLVQRVSPAPYYVQSVFTELEELNFPTEDGLKVYTGLQPIAQKAARKSMQANLKKLEERKGLKKIKEEDKKNLEGLLISIDARSGEVIALMGGRSYKTTQYNRALESRRQVGSIMKPLVYLAALEANQENGDPYSPMTIVKDEPLEHKYDDQVWSPRNYDRKFRGEIPMYYALKSSLNVPTARLGLEVGLENVVDIAKRLQIESKLSPLPSLTLGAFELSPLEVAQAYTTFARMGTSIEAHFIREIRSLDGDLYYEFEENSERLISPEVVSQLVGMMTNTLTNGTARSSGWRGWKRSSAGKTGTTSDTKDAWFGGFTPNIMTLVWVGYDDNTPHGLTGASGALPIWVDYMVPAAKLYPEKKFQWSEGYKEVLLDSDFIAEIIQEPNDQEFGNTSLVLREDADVRGREKPTDEDNEDDEAEDRDVF